MMEDLLRLKVDGDYVTVGVILEGQILLPSYHYEFRCYIGDEESRQCLQRLHRNAMSFSAAIGEVKGAFRIVKFAQSGWHPSTHLMELRIEESER